MTHSAFGDPNNAARYQIGHTQRPRMIDLKCDQISLVHTDQTRTDFYGPRQLFFIMDFNQNVEAYACR